MSLARRNVGAVAASVVAGLAGTAFGQLSPVGSATLINPGAGTLATWSTASMTTALTGTHATFNLRGDTTIVRNVPAMGQITDSVVGAASFSVGPLPVKLSNFRFSYDYKLVNGGGTGTTPSTVTSTIYVVNELVSFLPSLVFDPHAYNLSTGGTGVIGNGFKILTDSQADPFNNPPIVLGAGITYYAGLGLSTFTDPPTGFGLTPSTTVEFGGPFSSGFGGITLEFDYVTVPGPSAAMCLGGLGLWAARRRR